LLNLTLIYQNKYGSLEKGGNLILVDDDIRKIDPILIKALVLGQEL